MTLIMIHTITQTITQTIAQTIAQLTRVIPTVPLRRDLISCDLTTRLRRIISCVSPISSTRSLTIYALTFLFLGCGVRPLTLDERAPVEVEVTRRAVELIEAKTLPNQTPIRDIELTRTLLRVHPKTRRYLSHFITASDLISQSVRRLGGGSVGDLIVFKPLDRTLSVAIIYDVISVSRYRAVAILRGEVTRVEIDLKAPDKRRRGDEVINTIVRAAHPKDSPPYLYLAGELFYEFRRIF